MGELNLPPAPTRPVPALQCYLAYISALVVGIASWWALEMLQVFDNPLWIGLTITCMGTITIWVFSLVNGNSSIYDPYWVIAPPLLALAIKAAYDGLSSPWHLRQVIIFVCLIIWSFRYHFFYKWCGWRTGLVHEDWRYEQMRDFPLPYWLISLGGMHLFPTVLVYFAFAPAVLVFGESPVSQSAINALDILGAAGAMSAVVIQFFADELLRKFHLTKAYNKGGTYQERLWKYSRHPNYFGEVLFWLSMIPFAIAADIRYWNHALIWTGPIMMALFFRFSAWLMDRRSLERRPDYQQVMDHISPMIPWPPKNSLK